ncbi:MAG: hypothetical protein JW750_01580 [Anaerolineaceae bacterium]|nr:hypothetical protein [Anaerolineaceae bacterium]
MAKRIDLVNRIAVSILPTQAYCDWINENLPDDETGVTLAELREEGDLVLLPDEIDAHAVDTALDSVKARLLEMLLYSWVEDVNDLPFELNSERFDEWFETRLIPVVWDAAPGFSEAELEALASGAGQDHDHNHDHSGHSHSACAISFEEEEEEADESFTLFEVGDTVRLLDGTSDPETGIDMSGWQGNVIAATELVDENDPPAIYIEWDAQTLSNMPDAYIEHSLKHESDWSGTAVYMEDAEPAEARSSLVETESARTRIQRRFLWNRLGEAGESILKVIDPDHNPQGKDNLTRWDEHLHRHLTFPFKAQVTAPQEQEGVDVEDYVQVLDFNGEDAAFGVLMLIEKDGTQYSLPLVDLEVEDMSSDNFTLVDEYCIWLDNR